MRLAGLHRSGSKLLAPMLLLLIAPAQGPYRSMDELWDEPQPDHQALRQQMLAKYNNLDKQQPTATLNSGEWCGCTTACHQPLLLRTCTLCVCKCGNRFGVGAVHSTTSCSSAPDYAVFGTLLLMHTLTKYLVGCSAG